MTSSLLPLDVVLALALVVIGTSVLLARDLFQSIVLFIVFGMLLGIVWFRWFRVWRCCSPVRR